MNENTFLKRSKILEDNQDYLIDSVRTISQVFIEVINKGGKLIFAGNGGSAAEAQHMSAEYVGTLVTSNKRNPIPSIALSVDTSFITAWSNDHGYEDIFRRQLQALAKDNDCFISYSTSGESKNILNAIEYANSMKIKTVSFTGIKESRVSQQSFFTFKAPSSDTAIIQELHTIVGHEICSIIDKEFS
jgi:D-sedoheptulose 7-phosphate isomerase|tara:strand:- start:1653 stop:2216 length:564 start_codon:yes stop_codon:yes gene_type:complete